MQMKNEMLLQITLGMIHYGSCLAIEKLNVSRSSQNVLEYSSRGGSGMLTFREDLTEDELIPKCDSLPKQSRGEELKNQCFEVRKHSRKFDRILENL